MLAVRVGRGRTPPATRQTTIFVDPTLREPSKAQNLEIPWRIYFLMAFLQQLLYGLEAVVPCVEAAKPPFLSIQRSGSPPSSDNLKTHVLQSKTRSISLHIAETSQTL